MPDPTLPRFRGVVEAALGQIEARRQEINDLNVFPVADGDTGDNMALTLRAVLDELDRLAAGDGATPLDRLDRTEIVHSVARAALLGARGNSGVILSQLIRGAAEELASRPGELVDPVLIGAAMAGAANRAYDSVREPAEGTILTVVREMAHRIATELAHMPDSRLSAQAPAEVQDQLIAEVLESALQAGEDAVARGPEVMPLLREAGVVDAGAHGLVVILAGMIAALRGDQATTIAPAPATIAPAPATPFGPRVTRPHHESSTHRYCTNFAVTGQGLDARAHIPALERVGDSVLVVGDEVTLKVHVHTDAPDAATEVFAGVGEVSRLDVADMREQVRERSERLAAGDGAQPPPTRRPAAQCGAVAVVAGAGIAALYEGLGVDPLDGGPTLNPSTYELLAAIHDVPAEQVIVLPNSANVQLAAERAAELSEKQVDVVATRSQQAGLAVAVALSPDRDAAANAAAMGDALARVRAGGVAPSARDDAQGRFARGDAVGFLDEDIVAWGEPGSTLAAVLAAVGDGAELLTCLSGEGAPLDDERVRALAPEGFELECQRGEQPGWWWLVSAE